MGVSVVSFHQKRETRNEKLASRRSRDPAAGERSQHAHQIAPGGRPGRAPESEMEMGGQGVGIADQSRPFHGAKMLLPHSQQLGELMAWRELPRRHHSQAL